MMKKFIFLKVAVLSLLAACENEIDYRDENITPKLILNSLINIDSEDNYVYLDYTGRSFLGEVTDGSVEVSVNGELKETCEAESYWTGSANKIRYAVKTRFSPGDVVRIDARSGNGTYHAWAEDIIPVRPLLHKVDTMATSFNDGSMYSNFAQLKFKIDLEDIPNEKNFYKITMFHQYEMAGTVNMARDTVITMTNNNYWPWEDVVLTDGQPATSEELETGFVERVYNVMGIFKDVRFANNTYTMTVSSSYNIPSTAYLGFYDEWYQENDFIPLTMSIYTTVRLQSITESEYYYMNALNNIRSDAYDPYLYDPILIPSNVHGGTGMVGFSSETASERITITKDFKLTFGE